MSFSFPWYLLAQFAPNSNQTIVLSVPFPDNVDKWEEVNPEIAIVGDTIHFLLSSIRSGRGMIYYRNSTDGGKTLNQAQVIVDTTGNVNTFTGMSKHQLRRMSVVDNNIHIAYQIHSNIFYARSLDNRHIFSKSRIVASTENTSTQALHYPYISADSNRVVIAFTSEWGDS